MTNSRLVMLVLLAFASAAGLTCGQAAGQQGNETFLTTDDAGPINLSYIWSITGLEAGPVIMALSQEGEELFGSAKYDPDGGQAWNAAVIGKTDKEKVTLAMARLPDGDPARAANAIIMISADYDIASQSLQGEFFQASGGRIAGRGKIQAMWINPDISSYSPATVKNSPVEPARSSTEAQADAGAPQQVEAGASRFHDVHQDADRILTGVGDLSQIPIGMGGSGLA